MIGNSRLHWALFKEEKLQKSWDTEHIKKAEIENNENNTTPLILASVVPSQTALWQTYQNVRIITLEQIPLKALYPTLGIDRALAVWGAIAVWGDPMLVIDAGTALTFTGADNGQLIGGAILPGLGLQLKSLTQGTANLPKIALPSQIPPRWALNTPAAIQSGVVHAVVAVVRDFILDWWRLFPLSQVVFTGGDRTLLITYLQTQFPEIAARLTADPHLVFWGMRSLLTGTP